MPNMTLGTPLEVGEGGRVVICPVRWEPVRNRSNRPGERWKPVKVGAPDNIGTVVRVHRHGVRVALDHGGGCGGHATFKRKDGTGWGDPYHLARLATDQDEAAVALWRLRLGCADRCDRMRQRLQTLSKALRSRGCLAVGWFDTEGMVDFDAPDDVLLLSLRLDERRVP